MSITLILARSRNGAIGRKGDIPWRSPQDLAFFKDQTKGKAVIMGRATWDSLPVKPLPGRTNIVITRDSSRSMPGSTRAGCLTSALREANIAGHDDIFIIGGQNIYFQALPFASKMIITEVDVEVPDADRFFRPDMTGWAVSSRMALKGSDPECIVFEYRRICG